VAADPQGTMTDVRCPRCPGEEMVVGTERNPAGKPVNKYIRELTLHSKETRYQIGQDGNLLV